MEFIYSLEMVNGTFTPVRKDEIVRCKDCKHLVEIDDIGNLYVCARIDIGMDGEPNFLIPETDFCSRAEREETE